MLLQYLLLLSSGFALLSFSNAQPGPPVYVNTSLGPVMGYVASVDVNDNEYDTGENVVNVNVFRGIPFAASTAGPNRFMPPQPKEPWTDGKNVDAVSIGH